MNSVELARAVLSGNANNNDLSVGKDQFDNVIKAVAALSHLFDADEKRSFDTEVIRSEGVTNVIVSFDTYYFQFNKMHDGLFEDVFANAKRMLITVLDDDNLVNVKLIY